MAEQIKIRIYPHGTVQAEVAGVKGKKCTNHIGIIEDLLNAKVIDSEYTPEYYEKEVLEVYEYKKDNLEEYKEENLALNGDI